MGGSSERAQPTVRPLSAECEKPRRGHEPRRGHHLLDMGLGRLEPPTSPYQATSQAPESRSPAVISLVDRAICLDRGEQYGFLRPGVDSSRQWCPPSPRESPCPERGCSGNFAHDHDGPGNRRAPPHVASPEAGHHACLDPTSVRAQGCHGARSLALPPRRGSPRADTGPGGR